MSLVGRQLGPYQVLAKIGEGGMGEVYRARDTKLQRDVALKVLSAAVASDPDRLARFAREAQTLAALNHPNIAAIYGLEDSGPTSALVMELVDGDTLATRIAGGPMKPADAITLARQIIDGLDAAHQAGIVHRDLKPANIKVRPDGTVKILDFGLAKSAAMGTAMPDANTMTSVGRTEAGVVLGTVAYMSPEQARGQAVDRRADIWSFGVILYEMLSGARLFRGATTSDIMAAVLRDQVDWATLPATTPAPLRQLLEYCLSRDLSTRLPAISDARVMLNDAATGMSYSNAVRVQPTAPQSRGTLMWIVVAGLVIVGTAIAYWMQSGTATTASPTAVAVPRARSVAVLPFVTIGGKPEDDYFADGVTDDVIAGLGKVPNLKVAARSSAFTFKGQKTEVREVAKKLGVDSVLEGTVRKSGTRVRVTASLISAADGLQIWSQSFDSNGDDPFAVQDSVTAGVVSGLSLQLAGEALAASQAGRTKDPAAYDLYLRGKAVAQNASSEADLRRAIDLLQQSVTRDPKFALPYAVIGVTYLYLSDAYVPPGDAIPKARAAARAALERDERVAEAHAVLGYAEFATPGGDPAVVTRSFSRALELDPNSVTALQFRGLITSLNRSSTNWIADLQRAQSLDPLSPASALFESVGWHLRGEYKSALEAERRVQAIAPGYYYLESRAGAAYRELGDLQASLAAYLAADKALGGPPQYGLVLTYVALGRMDDARREVRRIDEYAKTHYWMFIGQAIAHAAIGEKDVALARLNDAVAHNEGLVLMLAPVKEAAPLVRDPRARKIIEDLGARWPTMAGAVEAIKALPR